MNLPRSLGDYDDLADLRTKLLARITGQRTAEAEDKLENASIEALVEKATIAYPPVAVDETVHELLSEVESARRPDRL